MANAEGFVAVGFGQDPFGGDGRVEDVFHDSGNSPRSSRMAGTAISTSPCFRRIFSWIRADRCRIRRMTSGFKGFPKARWSATACTSALPAPFFSLLAMLSSFYHGNHDFKPAFFLQRERWASPALARLTESTL